jgi:hypothetical protein
MCRAVRCKTCQKTTWSGCGAHVTQVKARVPADQWCGGHDDGGTKVGLFARWFGNRGGAA